MAPLGGFFVLLIIFYAIIALLIPVFVVSIYSRVSKVNKQLDTIISLMNGDKKTPDKTIVPKYSDAIT